MRSSACHSSRGQLESTRRFSQAGTIILLTQEEKAAEYLGTAPG